MGIKDIAINYSNIHKNALELFGLKRNFTFEELESSYDKIVKMLDIEDSSAKFLLKMVKDYKIFLIKEANTPKSITILNLFSFIFEGYFSELKKINVTSITLNLSLEVIPNDKSFKNESGEILELELEQKFKEFICKEVLEFSYDITIPERFKEYSNFTIKIWGPLYNKPIVVNMKNSEEKLITLKCKYEGIDEVIKYYVKLKLINEYYNSDWIW